MQHIKNRMGPEPGARMKNSVEMNDLPESLFANPVWHALQTKHRHFAISAAGAARYPPDVAPFAALETSDKDALRQLHSLLAPGESVWLIGESYPEIPELSFDGTLPCLQMVMPRNGEPQARAAQNQGRMFTAATEPRPSGSGLILPLPDIDVDILPLAAADAPEMVALTELAFPGYFRLGTCRMGSYYGVRNHGELIAMAGERLSLEGHSEISGVCTHPSHRGKGLAANLVRQLMRDHRRNGVTSFLQVAAANHKAVSLYRQLGFTVVRPVTLRRIVRRIVRGD